MFLFSRKQKTAKYWIISECLGTKKIREELMANIASAASTTQVPVDFQHIVSDKKILTQFLLDNTSLNLPNKTRINISLSIATGPAVPTNLRSSLRTDEPA